MKITGAFLAESATVVDGKLNVTGGVLRYYQVSTDRVATVNLVVLAEPETGDTAPTFTVEFITPSGDSQSEDIAMPVEISGEPTTFACWPLWIPVETDGQYQLVISGDRGSVTVPLTVHG